VILTHAGFLPYGLAGTGTDKWPAELLYHLPAHRFQCTLKNSKSPWKQANGLFFGLNFFNDTAVVIDNFLHQMRFIMSPLFATALNMTASCKEWQD
jgi:hypothetical protein